MITEDELQKTVISFSYTISPAKNVICDLSAMIGNFCEETIESFYPRTVSKKANIVITELLNNALENSNDSDSKIGIKLQLDEEHLVVKVINIVDQIQFEKVKAHIEKINTTENIRNLLRETILARRKDRLKGGLGLIRLVAENKFKLSVDYRKPYLIVESQYELGGWN
jgi:hypothetical protein